MTQAISTQTINPDSRSVVIFVAHADDTEFWTKRMSLSGVP